MNQLLGTGALVKLGLRRDRIMIAVWAYAATAFAASTSYSYGRLYDTVQSRREFAEGVEHNGATRAMYGRVFNADTVGGLTAWRVTAIGAALVGVLCILLVVRHTRGDEEAGRLELVGAGVVGRYAALTAGLLIALLADALLAVLVCAGLIAIGMPTVGSIAFGMAWFAAGAVFAAVAATAAQLAQSARLANGIALGVLGVAFLIRAAGDAGQSWLSWLSPIAWSQQLRPFADNRWWVLALPVLLVVIVAAIAYALAGHRDLGAGLLPSRPGPAVGAPGLRSPLALAWRLQRGPMAGWAAGFLVYGAVLGGVADGVTDLVKDSKGTRDILVEMGGQKGLVDAFIATVMGMLGLIVSVYAVQAVLRLRVEETGQRAEPVLATRVGRIRWAMSHVTFAVVGSVVLLVLAGFSAGLVHGLRVHDVGHQLPRVLGAALVQLPAAFVLAGVALLLFGLAPRLAMASWGVLGAFLLLGQLGPVLKLAQWAMDISPFTHVPKAPGAAVLATPLVALCVVAALLAAAGLAGFRERDIG